LLLSPLFPAVPLVTLANCVREAAFAYRWAPTARIAASQPFVRAAHDTL